MSYRNQGPEVCDECCVVETVVLLINQLGQKCGVPGLNYTIRYISGLAPLLAAGTCVDVALQLEELDDVGPANVMP